MHLPHLMVKLIFDFDEIASGFQVADPHLTARQSRAVQIFALPHGLAVRIDDPQNRPLLSVRSEFYLFATATATEVNGDIGARIGWRKWPVWLG